MKKSCGHYISSAIILLNKFAYFMIVLQIIIAVVLRYLYIFHQTILNHFEDSKIISALRFFVGIICVTLTLIEIPKVEDRHSYALLMNQDVDREKLKQNSNSNLLIVSTLAVLIIVYVQIRIEIYKKIVDCQNCSVDQMEAGNSGNVKNHKKFLLRKNLLRPAMMLLCFLFLIIIDGLLRHRWEADDLFIARLRMKVMLQFISIHIILILIRRNCKAYKFCVNQIKYCLL